MNLKKNKKLKRKFEGFQIEYRNYVGFHVYRSEDKDAPFSEWERVTEKPSTASGFTDRFDENNPERAYYYKVTDVDARGNESAPRDAEDLYSIKDGKRTKRDPKTTILGVNIYWSIDPDVPLDRWTRQNDEPIKEEKFVGACPVREPYYMYCKYVNMLGEEIGKPSDIQRIVPRA